MFSKVLFSLLFFTSIIAQASVPNLINYQGQLTDANGDALASDVYDLTFKIYDALVDGNLKWEETHADIPVVKGFYNVVLGKNVDITPAFSSASAFLEITVDTSTPIAPRQQVLSSPYAVKSGDGAPTGSIMAYWGTIAPEGWLLCDGTAIPDGPKYDALKALVGSNAPDLKDMFLRGKSDSRSIGNFQEDAFQGHSHHSRARGGAGQVPGNQGGFVNDATGANVDMTVNDNYVTYPIELNTYEAPRFASETRPKNIAVNYIIKF
jgi:hypothetical protein